MKLFAGLIMSIYLMGCGANWDRHENDYALVIDVYENHFKMEKITHYDPRKVFDRYLEIKEENKDITIEEMGSIIEQGKTKYEDNIRDVLLQHIQKDKKILIIISGYGPFLKKRKSEISDLLESDNIQLQLQEISQVKLNNDT